MATAKRTSTPVELTPGEDSTGAAALVPDQMPEPTAVKGVIYPAWVQVPGEQPRERAKVYIAPEGLYVYWAVPDDPQDWTPDYWAPITWPQPKLPPPHMQRMGFQLETDYGAVVITTDGGCGCNWPLKYWVPEYANHNVAW